MELTGITDERLAAEGIPEGNAAAAFANMIYSGRTLLVAHNAQFDLLFAREMLKRFTEFSESGDILSPCDYLDSLTVYKDRRAYPHKLANAIAAYKLEDKVKNSHRAIDDVEALLEVCKAMDNERADLLSYVNVFGYNPKYGVTGDRLSRMYRKGEDVGYTQQQIDDRIRQKYGQQNPHLLTRRSMTRSATHWTQQEGKDKEETKMFNHVGLLGRLAQEPEIRYTTGGTPVARFDLVVPVPSKKKDTPPDYIPVVCWDKWADFCGKYLTKGRQVVVEGRITTRKWQDNDGKHRKAVEVTASRIYFADSNYEGGGTNGNAQQTDAGDGFMSIPDGVDDELPFN